MKVLDAYPWIGDAFADIREEHGGLYVSCECPLKPGGHRTSRLRFWCGEQGNLLFGCYACGKGAKLEILRAVGKGWPDCYPPKTDWKAVKRVETARYPYEDEAGVLLYETVRMEPGYGGKDKTFFQRRPTVPGTRPRGRDGWTAGLYLPGAKPPQLAVRLVLYRLPQLVQADPREPVYVVAGEKDADSLRALGLVATTNVCGESTAWADAYSAALAGRAVTVIEDVDGAGARHANEVCGSLLSHVASLRRLRMPGAKDATEFLMRLRTGGVVEPARLRAAVESAAGESRLWIGV